MQTLTQKEQKQHHIQRCIDLLIMVKRREIVEKTLKPNHTYQEYHKKFKTLLKHPNFPYNLYILMVGGNYRLFTKAEIVRGNICHQCGLEGFKECKC